MEQNESKSSNMPPVMQCRTGCGYYASSATDGMCSKCYKDALKRKQQNPSPTPAAGVAGRTTPTEASIMETISKMSSASFDGPSEVEGATTSKITHLEGATALLEASVPNTTAEIADKKKRNRCQECRKKVGLTGFGCRCGGLFCGAHRYSDKHDCSFNYKELAQEQIRKNNPVVMGEKVHKL